MSLNDSLDSDLLDGFQTQQSKTKDPTDPSNPSDASHPSDSGIPKTPLNFTDSAIKQLHRLRDKKGDPNLGVRVGVNGGGCSGLSYFLKFEESPRDNDIVMELTGPLNPATQRPNDLKAWVDPKSARFIAGTTIDFDLSNFLEGGFKFTNPNAAKSCGCGTSFTPKAAK